MPVTLPLPLADRGIRRARKHPDTPWCFRGSASRVGWTCIDFLVFSADASIRKDSTYEVDGYGGFTVLPQEQLVLVMAGSAILTVGLLSLWAHFASALSRERILLWFGLFAGSYGLTLILRNILIPELNNQIAPPLMIIDRLIGIAATIPALLLYREFYGRDRRIHFQWLIWPYALALVSVLILLGMHERASTIPSPGITLVFQVPLVLMVDRLAGYRPPPIKGQRVIFMGLAVFFLTFAYDRVSHLRTGDIRVTKEPFGFLILTICLGYVVSRRVAAKEAEWISMAGEMQAARKMQAAILPAAIPQVAQWSIAARYSPMTAVAGDFYGFPHVGEESMEIIVADVMGHGVPAALVASMVKVGVFAGYKNGSRPNDIISGLNTMLSEEAPGSYTTAVYVSLSRESGLGWYSAAGHPPPLLWRRNSQTLDKLDSPGLLLGVRKEEVFTLSKFQFEKGDRLLLYSDGLTEAEDAAGLSFGVVKLPGLFASRQSYTAEAFADRLLKDVLAWAEKGSGPGQTDDITFVVVDLT